MKSFEYNIRTVSGLFKFRSTKLVELQATCDEMGKNGWELVSVSYDWFFVSYTLFFKRIKVS